MIFYLHNFIYYFILFKIKSDMTAFDVFGSVWMINSLEYFFTMKAMQHLGRSGTRIQYPTLAIDPWSLSCMFPHTTCPFTQLNYNPNACVPSRQFVPFLWSFAQPDRKPITYRPRSRNATHQATWTQSWLMVCFTCDISGTVMTLGAVLWCLNLRFTSQGFWASKFRSKTQSVYQKAS